MKKVICVLFTLLFLTALSLSSVMPRVYAEDTSETYETIPHHIEEKSDDTFVTWFSIIFMILLVTVCGAVMYIKR